MLFVIDVEIAPKKNTPIIAQIILSKAIAGEKPWPELIIIKTYKRNNQNHQVIWTQKRPYNVIFKKQYF